MVRIMIDYFANDMGGINQGTKNANAFMCGEIQLSWVVQQHLCL